VAPRSKQVFSVSVRELVEFSLRQGDLGGERDFVGPSRALAGIRGHQKIQHSRPAGYQKEVPLAHEIEDDGFILRIQGRIDGLLAEAAPPLLEEIKTVQGRWDAIAGPLHWAQAKIYGFLYARQHALERLAIRLTYLHLETGKVTQFDEECLFPQLCTFFDNALGIYLDWVRERHQWCRQRDESLRAVEFPFKNYRPGQRELAVAAYRTLSRGERVFVEAPTGIGKTVSVLFPAVKALGEGRLERLFYLTARTVGRAVAEKAFNDLRQAGARLRTLTLTAREKICVQQGHPCDMQTCPLARGYYDRNKAAMREALGQEEITRRVLEAIGQQYQVCPFELSLDLSLWVDAVICDYNYVFDPKVYLRRHFAEEGGDCAFLVDEAHNLVDRGREMFSAELDGREIQETRKAFRGALPRCARALQKLGRAMRKACGSSAPATEPVEPTDPALELNLFPAQAVSGRRADAAPLEREVHPEGFNTTKQFPNELLAALDDALKEAEAWLARNEPADFRESLLELYFRLFSFRRTGDLYDEHYVTVLDRSARSMRVRLFCLDPSFLLRQALTRGRAAVFFSATLTPLDYYRELLGGSAEDRVLQLPSPFPPENLAVLLQDRVRTHFKARNETLLDVAQAIGATVAGRPGNYLVYCPSYQYLNAVHGQFLKLYPTAKVLAQRPNMSESEREAFLAAFTATHRETLVGFAVMGGIFGEGIDLVGERLIGAVVVGVGLPQLCIERDLIRDYFQEKTGTGFDYAYTFPGMNRVLQATGRVIRSETDRGVVLLIDARFGERRYLRLMPHWWRPTRVRSVAALQEAGTRFWEAQSVSAES
jgi:DNA excision repair protein ERCC-2